MAPTPGRCLTCHGRDQNKEFTDIGSGGGLSESQCLSKCKADTDAKACEFHVISGGCTAHKESVSKGNGNGRYKCWTKAKLCKGKKLFRPASFKCLSQRESFQI